MVYLSQQTLPNSHWSSDWMWRYVTLPCFAVHVWRFGPIAVVSKLGEYKFWSFTLSFVGRYRVWTRRLRFRFVHLAWVRKLHFCFVQIFPCSVLRISNCPNFSVTFIADSLAAPGPWNSFCTSSRLGGWSSSISANNLRLAGGNWLWLLPSHARTFPRVRMSRHASLHRIQCL